MTPLKSNRKPALRSKNSDKKIRKSVARTTARKTVKLKPGTKSVAARQPRPVSQRTGRTESKKSWVIAMLQAPGGATIDAMTRATGWQQHSVRGFLAGVVRKKLGLDLVSADGDKGRVYRITDRMASAAA